MYTVFVYFVVGQIVVVKGNEKNLMIKGYLTINEVAEKWGIIPRRVRALCKTGRIKGASKLGREWAIPSNAERPVDKRMTTGAYINWRKTEGNEK